jgi:hypothetical protein
MAPLLKAMPAGALPLFGSSVRSNGLQQGVWFANCLIANLVVASRLQAGVVERNTESRPVPQPGGFHLCSCWMVMGASGCRARLRYERPSVAKGLILVVQELIAEASRGLRAFAERAVLVESRATQGDTDPLLSEQTDPARGQKRASECR